MIGEEDRVSLTSWHSRHQSLNALTTEGWVSDPEVHNFIQISVRRQLDFLASFPPDAVGSNATPQTCSLRS